MRKKTFLWSLGIGLTAVLVLGSLGFARYETQKQQTQQLHQEGAAFVESVFAKLEHMSYEDPDPFAPVQTDPSTRIYLEHFRSLMQEKKWVGLQNHVNVTYEGETDGMLDYFCEASFLFQDPSGKQSLQGQLIGVAVRQDSPHHFVLVSMMNTGADAKPR